jgi:hypothetical protein
LHAAQGHEDYLFEMCHLPSFLVTGVCWANIEFDQRETNIVSSLCVVLWSCLNSFKGDSDPVKDK